MAMVFAVLVVGNTSPAVAAEAVNILAVGTLAVAVDSGRPAGGRDKAAVVDGSVRSARRLDRQEAGKWVMGRRSCSAAALGALCGG